MGLKERKAFIRALSQRNQRRRMSSEGVLMYVALRRRWMSLLFYLVGLLILSRKQYMATNRVHPFSSFRRMINVSLIPTESSTYGSGTSNCLFIFSWKLALQYATEASALQPGTSSLFTNTEHGIWNCSLHVKHVCVASLNQDEHMPFSLPAILFAHDSYSKLEICG